MKDMSLIELLDMAIAIGTDLNNQLNVIGELLAAEE